MTRVVFLLLSTVILVAPSGVAQKKTTVATYAKDVETLLDEIEQKAGHFLKQKEVDWKAVRRRSKKELKKVRSDADHFELCRRILASARDGHAVVLDVNFEIPEDRAPPPQKGVGMNLAINGRKVLVKDCWGPAASSGIESGWEVTSIEGKKPLKWIEERAELLSETRGYSTEAAALYAACHRGLADEAGTTWSFKFKKVGGGTAGINLTCGGGGGNGVPAGPMQFPDDVERLGRHAYGHVGEGVGYIHLRKIEQKLPQQLDQMLAALGPIEALVLDFRSNTGGSVDHDAVFSRFLEPEQNFGGRRALEEGHHFTGPIVVIVDAGSASAAETVSAMFSESGRGYMIGPTHTAGMSGDKEVLELPSGLMTVRFTIRSWKAGGSGGPAIEGVGVQPHEIVEFDPKRMAAGEDPFVARALERLEQGLPKERVRYRSGG